MQKTYDIHVERFEPLISPAQLKEQIPIGEPARQTVVQGRRAIADILEGKDSRLLVIAGPCSIHDETAALEYARRLKALGETVADTMLLVMRVYFEKPRTNVGWKGLINDPWLNGSYDINTGLRKARQLLCSITELGLPTATEMLDPIVPQYIAGLVCWAAIGARTTESQTHREMASGLSMPVGFKNCTDGELSTAINAMIAAGSPQSFLGIDPDGQTSIVKTTGNPHAHIVLRGGSRPNYDTVSIGEAIALLEGRGLSRAIMVDCSHDNSRKNHNLQAGVWQDVINQRLDGNDAIIGMMLESSLAAGNQKNTGDLRTMQYGVSITDACIDWETTEQLILSAHAQLDPAANRRQGNGAHRYKVG
ncbi:MAG TPA: 3-deoxy-7-phosphoheptulonate synthase [Desulfosarcina sp.]|nr:3-deoxy-7-phosphoheptulonate synthase [Desulfosarcina sp.]